MESGSDNQSEQQSSSRMSRMVAVLVVLGLIGSAFLLGRVSVTASVSQSVQLRFPGTCATGFPGGAPANQAAAAAAIAAAPGPDKWQLCQDLKACGPQFNLAAIPDCTLAASTCPGGNAPVAPNPLLHERFLAALADNPGDVKAVCDALKNACPDQKGKDEIAAFPRCKGLSPCEGGVKPVCISTHHAPDLGEQFSCMTAGKPEVEMMNICAIFKAACKNAADQAWLNARPRCNWRIPRHDGRLDYITREKFERAAR